jgi:N-acetylglucosamine-6-phosphate deacetylase
MIITNARIFNGIKFLNEDSIKIKNGKIVDIFKKANKNFLNEKVIDLKKNILAPGLIDIHTHGAGGINSLEIQKSKDIIKIAKSYAKTGTTSIVLTTAYSFFKKDHLKLISKNKNQYTKILGIYLESPFVNLKKRGMIQDQYVMKDVDDPEVLIKDIMKSCGKAALKIITIAPEIKNSYKIQKYFKNKKIIIAFGHSLADYEQTKKAIKNGVQLATHFLNAMNPIHHRNPGPAVAILENKNVFIEIIADGNHIHPSVIKLIYNIAGKNRIILITDATGDKILKDGIYNNKRYGKIIIKNNGVYSVDGVLIGTNLSLLDMCKNMKKWLNLKIEDVLQMVTYNPGKLLGEKIGMIEKGFFADFVILDQELNLKKVFINGEQVK